MWKRDGCPAFNEDGSVDLSALTAWLEENCLGLRGSAAEQRTFFRRPAATYFEGGRDFASELDSIHSEATRFRDLLEDEGHTEAAEKFWRDCYDGIRPTIDGFVRYLESVGLAEPLGD